MLPFGLAINLTQSYPGATADVAIFCANKNWHMEFLQNLIIRMIFLAQERIQNNFLILGTCLWIKATPLLTVMFVLSFEAKSLPTGGCQNPIVNKIKIFFVNV